MPLQLALLTLSFLFPQTEPSKPTLAAIHSALLGSWTGTLQYRDYQSDQLVSLPTWLDVTSADNNRSLIFHYTYDDGPDKIVHETSLVRLDLDKNTFTVSSEDGKESDTYQMSGADKLSASGLGTLTMTGSGMDNKKKVDVRITLRLDRNSYSYLRETRLPDESFQMRDAYTFTRRNPPSS
jgi:hypothetical protein